MPGCFLRNSIPDLMSSAFASKSTAASLLSDRGFIASTMKPRFASSVVARCVRKLLVR